VSEYLLAIDQGTTSSRAILFDTAGNIVEVAQEEFTQHFPADGWVEHDPEEIWSTTLEVVRDVVDKAGADGSEIRAIGITNQRETTIIWDRETGEPIHNAIVWQDRRTADFCDSLKAEGFEPEVTSRTGLLLDPYFSGTKVKWLLDNVEGARDKAERGELAFGTVDSFLLWRLTGGRSHKTDATNASRTLLFNIHQQCWDQVLLDKLDIPLSMMPEVEDCAADFGYSEPAIVGASIPIAGMAGDQQAAMVGQCCFEVGATKSTYGTGCFVIMNTGDQAVASSNKLLTTVGYRLNGKVTYGLEGSIFIAGAAVQWLRDGLKLVDHAGDTEEIARKAESAKGVYMVPAFTGLGAPYWDANARGAIIGLTRDSGVAELVVATLESVCYQTRDLMEAMTRDGVGPTVLRVDGGMVVNDWVTQRLADVLGITVDRPQVTETTALGAAYLAGLQVGVFQSLEDLSAKWQLQRQFTPEMSREDADSAYEGWVAAVKKVQA